MRVVKVIPCFPYTTFRKQGTSTNGSPDYKTWLKTFTNMMNQEMTVDTGIDTDIFLYYRFIKGDETGKKDIHKYHLEKTKNGTIYVTDMENDKTIGFTTIKNFLNRDVAKEYDLFLYQEDDIQILSGSDGYLKEAADLIQNKIYDIVSFVITVRWPVVHFGGFFGLIPIRPLINNIQNFPLMDMGDEVEVNKWATSSLGTTFDKIGYLSDYDNRPENYASVGVYNQKYVIPFWKIGKKFLFKVGPT